MNKDKVKYYTYQLDMTMLNVLAIILFVGMYVILYLLGYNFEEIYNDVSMVGLIVLLVAWLMLHEVLHGIGFGIFKEVNKRNITFGMALEKGVFYCMCKQKISKLVIFTSLLFPFTIIGVVTMILGILIDNSLLIYLSIFNIVGSIGDIMMSFYFLKCPKEVEYLDLDDCTSFTVLSNKNLEQVKLPGIKLVGSGAYNSSMKAYDKRKLVISRASWYVLIVIFILILIDIIGGIL